MQQHITRFIIGLGVAFGLMFLLLAVASALRSGFTHSGNIIPRGPTPPGERMCTMEARLCPDGSTVGRSGPNCEFASCPTGVNQTVIDFDSCVARGNPVMESFPRQCSMNGRTYIEELVTPSDGTDNPRISEPHANSIVTSPLTVRGQAPGSWFFEGSFPVQLLGVDGKILASGLATAEGDWMTTSPVPFMATLSFPSPQSGSGTLVLERDNPSGLPEMATSVSVPIRFESKN